MYQNNNVDGDRNITLDLIQDSDLLSFFKENYHLENPNDIYDFLQDEENIRMIMEYIQGNPDVNLV